jgi:uncharacterized protein
MRIGGMVRFVRWFALFAALVLPQAAGALETFEKSSLTIETASGGHLRFQIELAISEAQQAQGMMFRQKMAPDAGMLFVYKAPQASAFWMENTYIPLDMLFIEPDGRIERIIANAAPLTTTPRQGPAKTKAVLEINGGLAAKLGIRTGDKVIHPLLGTAN